jgi:hypothetical protein
LTAEQELFARYDRELEVPPFLWTRIAQHTVAENNGARTGWLTRLFALPVKTFASVIAILLLAIALGVVYLKTRQPAAKPEQARKEIHPTPVPRESSSPAGEQPEQKLEQLVFVPPGKRKPAIEHNSRIDQSDVLSSDFGYADIDDQDTAKHIEQTQNLLRSIRNVPVPDGDEEIDVTYDKALSRRLLNQNVVLRRDAEMKAKFPTKTLLADLEPFLIDIANLPDHARPEEVRVIKERVQKTEIVAALMSYQSPGTNNR